MSHGLQSSVRVGREGLQQLLRGECGGGRVPLRPGHGPPPTRRRLQVPSRGRCRGGRRARWTRGGHQADRDHQANSGRRSQAGGAGDVHERVRAGLRVRQQSLWKRLRRRGGKSRGSVRGRRVRGPQPVLVRRLGGHGDRLDGIRDNDPLLGLGPRGPGGRSCRPGRGGQVRLSRRLRHRNGLRARRTGLGGRRDPQ